MLGHSIHIYNLAGLKTRIETGIKAVSLVVTATECITSKEMWYWCNPSFFNWTPFNPILYNLLPNAWMFFSASSNTFIPPPPSSLVDLFLRSASMFTSGFLLVCKMSLHYLCGALHDASAASADGKASHRRDAGTHISSLKGADI